MSRLRAALPLLIAAAIVPAPAAAQDEPGNVSLNWVGDMAFSRVRGPAAERRQELLRRRQRAYLGRGDLTTGNLEGTLGRGPTTKCRGNCHEFQAPPSYARVFRRAGFGLLNLANNHSHDAGPAGLRETTPCAAQGAASGTPA